MADYAFLLDIARCIGCQACLAACKTGNEVPAGAQYIRFAERTTGAFPNLRGWIANHRCYHCLSAPCVKVCPTGALFKEDGMTRLNTSECIGCGNCVETCPYSVPVLFEGVASKCDGCAAVVAAGGSPWCAKTCPTGALLYGERAAILSEAESRVAALRERYPRARVYGAREGGGLGLIMVLPDSPRVLDLIVPPPETGSATAVHAAQPLSLGFTGVGAVVAAFATIIDRRNRLGPQRAHAAGTGDVGKVGRARLDLEI
jgi:Fe-S-cluster-containing dehydrogenase component